MRTLLSAFWLFLTVAASSAETDFALQDRDTASGAVSRLERDVFSKGATVFTVAFGVNDIGWGMKANAESKQRYLDEWRDALELQRDASEASGPGQESARVG